FHSGSYAWGFRLRLGRDLRSAVGPRAAHDTSITRKKRAPSHWRDRRDEISAPPRGGDDRGQQQRLANIVHINRITQSVACPRQDDSAGEEKADRAASPCPTVRSIHEGRHEDHRI